MKCAYAKSHMTAYLERMCAKTEVAEIARHIELCHTCAQELRDHQRLRSLMHGLRDIQPDPVFLSDLSTSIRERTTHAHLVPGLRVSSSRYGRRMHLLLATAAVLLATAVTIGWHSLTVSPQSATHAPSSQDDTTFILQEHVLPTGKGVFSNGAVGAVVVNYPRKNNP